MNHNIKLITLGDSAVGKSSLLMKYFDNLFSSTFITTIGIDFKLKKIILDNITYNISIWDTAGQERFRTITTSYIRGTKGAILLFDVCDMKSFTNITKWIDDIQKVSKEINIFLIGNKIDKKDERVVLYETAKEYADKLKIDYYEVSCKKGINVKETMDEIIKKVIEIYKPKDKDCVNLEKTSFKKKCC